MKNNNHITATFLVAALIAALWAWVQICQVAYADQMTHKFKSPSFNGIGTSAHYLTIENQEKTRSDAIREKRVSDEDKRIAATKNTNYAKFLKNLESRIYARFSKELEEAVFGEKCGTQFADPTGTVIGTDDAGNDIIGPPYSNTEGGTATAPSPAVENNMVSSNVRDGNPTGDIRNNHPTPSCSGTMEFNGTTMTWTKDNVNDVVKLEIDGPDGGQIIEMPLNDFQF